MVPSYVTHGGAHDPATGITGATGRVVGEQAFGPYGERMAGTFNGRALPSGHRPVTGYTGQLAEDATGLIYMRGRYYSPLWHRFVSPDRGADPNGPNQYAYVGGRPFSATDPSGMAALVCVTHYYTTWPPGETSGNSATVIIQNNSYTECVYLGAGGGGYGWGDHWGGGWAGPAGPAALAAGGDAEPKAPEARAVTEGDCDVIRDILRVQKKWGNRLAAIYGLHNGLLVGSYTSNTSDGYHNLFPTSRGDIDLDWYATLAALGAPRKGFPAMGLVGGAVFSFVTAHSNYILAKSAWEVATLLIPGLRGGGSYSFEGPYGDPGERAAVDAFAHELKFSDLFDQAWFDEHCGGK